MVILIIVVIVFIAFLTSIVLSLRPEEPVISAVTSPFIAIFFPVSFLLIVMTLGALLGYFSIVIYFIIPFVSFLFKKISLYKKIIFFIFLMVFSVIFIIKPSYSIANVYVNAVAGILILMSVLSENEVKVFYKIAVVSCSMIILLMMNIPFSAFMSMSTNCFKEVYWSGAFFIFLIYLLGGMFILKDKIFTRILFYVVFISMIVFLYWLMGIGNSEYICKHDGWKDILGKDSNYLRLIIFGLAIFIFEISFFIKKKLLVDKGKIDTTSFL